MLIVHYLVEYLLKNQRESADSSLSSRVSTEESVRESADSSLSSRVSTEESTRASDVSSLHSEFLLKNH